MRIVVDMQGAQTGSRFRGIGRYTVSLTKAMIENCDRHDVILVLSSLFPETIDALRTEFAGLIPRENIRIWHASGPTQEVDASNACRRRVAEKMREAFLLELRPDIVLITSLFEGLGDDAIGTVGDFYEGLPAAVILYDLIPLINPDPHFRTSKVHQTWYSRKIESLKRANLLLAISESARQEAVTALNFPPDGVVNVSGGCSDFFHITADAVLVKDEVCHRLGIERPFVMYTGGADERKNLHRLIKAYAALPSKVKKKHQLVFAGKMQCEQVAEYIKTAQSSGLAQEDLVFTGYVDDADLRTLYNTCALFVFPSTHEGFGLPPLEAMACGAPVIGSNATSLPEVIGLDEALFDPCSVDAISAKMHQALSDEQFRQRLTTHARVHYRNFSWVESAKRALRAMERYQPDESGVISHLLSFEKTAKFGKRCLKILAVKLDHMGDFLLAVPALTKLKARYPYAKIDVVVGSWNVSAAEMLGLFDKVFIYDYYTQKSSEPPSLKEEKLEKLLSELECYDIALDLRRQPDTRFFLALVSARMKVGYQTFVPGTDEQLDVVVKSYLDTPCIATPLNKKNIASQMIAVVDAIPYDVNDYLVFPDTFLALSKEKGSVAIFPKAGNEVKEWPATSYNALVDQLLNNQQISRVTVYFARPDEAREFDFSTSPKLSIQTGLTFIDLAKSLASHELCIANNSGGAHLASYIGTKVVGVYSGHELPDEWGPLFNHGYVIHRNAACSPCHAADQQDCPHELFCMHDIGVNDVYSAAIRLLDDDLLEIGSLDTVQPVKGGLPQNCDTIVSRLITAIAPDVKMLSSDELIKLSEFIAQNHPAYPLPPDLTCIRSGEYVKHTSDKLTWHGFSDAEHDFRWSVEHEAEIEFRCGDVVPSSGVLTLYFDTFGAQHVALRLNGTLLTEQVLCGGHIELKVPVTSLSPKRNRLAFSLPGARQPGNGDLRTVAVAIRAIKLEV